MNKPNLTDNKLVTFFSGMNKNIHIKDPIIIRPKSNNLFFINLIFISIIFIFCYILYRRNKLKKYNGLIYENKLKNLYNNIINY